MTHPLQTNRYINLAERINVTLRLVNEYLELRIESFKKEKKNNSIASDNVKSQLASLTRYPDTHEQDA